VRLGFEGSTLLMAEFEAKFASKVRETLYLVVAADTSLLLNLDSSEVANRIAEPEDLIKVVSLVVKI
jgi:hypothetical protein